MKRIPILIILLALGLRAIVAQEIVTGLYENPVIRAEHERQAAGAATRQVNDDPQPLQLPFFDDFNQSFIYPDARKWADKEAYINSNFPYRSANIGAATLDAIDSRGELHQNASQFPFQADSLTSNPIRLDSVFAPQPRSIRVADSLYLSFYYQPQGKAVNHPDGPDSLILQFGYYTGDSLFTGTYDSIWVPASLYISPGDTIEPGDTIYSPEGCIHGLYSISGAYYFYEDLLRLPCDSVFIPEFRWKRIWSAPGTSLEEFQAQYGTFSRQVMIPITDSLKYFNADFRFRFINFASLASDFNASWKSNCDYWNVDYIYLNINRSYRDTVFRDVTFAERAPSFLKNYEAMPYPQYINDPTNEMKENLDMVIVNLDSSIYNSTYYYAVYEIDGPFSYLYPGGNCNLFPFNINGYQNCIACAAHACPPVNFLFPLQPSKDSAEFEVRHFIIGDITPQDTIGDTTSYRQKFFNYYAYDDGTPEEGYGLTPSGSQLAYRFKLNVKDTLRAVQMFFNRTLNDANEQMFDLVVWRDNNGKPGDELYRQQDQIVKFSDGLLGFQSYMLDQPVPVNGVFYVGWQQFTNDNLNLGYDKYNSARQNIFYNSTGEWFQSTFEGALMIRPVLGKQFQWAGTGEGLTMEGSITPYPNPLNNNQLRFNTTGMFTDPRQTEDLRVRVSNLLGQTLIDEAFAPVIRFEPGAGVYILHISDPSGRIVSVSKLVKN